MGCFGFVCLAACFNKQPMESIKHLRLITQFSQPSKTSFNNRQLQLMEFSNIDLHMVQLSYLVFEKISSQFYYQFRFCFA